MSESRLNDGTEGFAKWLQRALLVDPKIVSLLARLEDVFLDRQLYRCLLGCRGTDAQRLLDSFQWVLDMPELNPALRRNLIVATQRLSAASGLYPVCYELKDIVHDNQYPVVAGGFADIYKGTLNGQPMCIKAIRVYERSQVVHILKKFSREAILWGQLFHPNILPVYGLFRFQNRACLVSPWMEEGDITKYLKHRPTADRLRLAIDVARGLLYLHQNAIIHGDLKGPNILIDDEGSARLADFGLSSISDPEILAWTTHSAVASQGGSVRWQAPELFDTENDEMVANSVASDVYSWSCVCYEIFTGDIPFPNIPRDATIIFKVKAGARPLRPPESSPSWCEWGLSEKIWSVMEHCWKDDPTQRPSMERIIEQLTFTGLHDAQWSNAKGGLLTPAVFRRRAAEPLELITESCLDALLLGDADEKSTIPGNRGRKIKLPPSPDSFTERALKRQRIMVSEHLSHSTSVSGGTGQLPHQLSPQA